MRRPDDLKQRRDTRQATTRWKNIDIYMCVIRGEMTSDDDCHSTKYDNTRHSMQHTRNTTRREETRRVTRKDNTTRDMTRGEMAKDRSLFAFFVKQKKTMGWLNERLGKSRRKRNKRLDDSERSTP